MNREKRKNNTAPGTNRFAASRGMLSSFGGISVHSVDETSNPYNAKIDADAPYAVTNGRDDTLSSAPDTPPAT